MTQDQIDSYREKIDLQLKEKSNEIESNISLIIVGSLGFFLTINEKFIGLREAEYKEIMYLSVAALIMAFMVYLYNKHLTTKYDRILLDYIDDNLKPNEPEKDNILLENSTTYNKNVVRGRNLIYILLGLGIVAQVIFFLLNFQKGSTSNKEKSLQIEIITRADSTIKNSPTVIIKPDSNIVVTHKKDSTR